MKKKIIMWAATLLIFGLTGCKKDYTCHCKKTSNAGEDHFTVHERKKKANEACEAIKNANPSVYALCEIE